MLTIFFSLDKSIGSAEWMTDRRHHPWSGRWHGYDWDVKCIWHSLLLRRRNYLLLLSCSNNLTGWREAFRLIFTIPMLPPVLCPLCPRSVGAFHHLMLFFSSMLSMQSTSSYISLSLSIYLSLSHTYTHTHTRTVSVFFIPQFFARSQTDIFPHLWHAAPREQLLMCTGWSQIAWKTDSLSCSLNWVVCKQIHNCICCSIVSKDERKHNFHIYIHRNGLWAFITTWSIAFTCILFYMNCTKL